MKELRTAKLYKGFTYGNYQDNTNKWLKSIYDNDVVFERTDNYIHQSNNPDRDYQNFLNRKKKYYATPKVTVLVKDGKRVCQNQ